MKNEDKKFNVTWFFKWILNSQSVTVLFVSLLFFLNVLVFTKISFLFQPVLVFLTTILLPIVISALLYYLVEPIVHFLERRGLKRTMAISTVFVIILGLLIWGIGVLIPNIEEQLTNLVTNLPNYVKEIEQQIENIIQNDSFARWRPDIEEVLATVTDRLTEYAETFSKSALNWAGNFASTVARVAIAVVMSPFILFYLLRDGKKLETYISYFIPTKMKQPTIRVLRKVNRQLSGYVQGQVTVAIVVAMLFSVMYSIINLRYAVTLGIIAGILNMVPYLGSFLAMVPAFIIAIASGPFMILKVAIVFLIEQTVEGRFVTPLVLGSRLNIHPITILFVLLTSGTMFGVWGVFLGIPVYASAKVVITELFEWYRTVSSLYEAEEVAEKMTKIEEGESHAE